MNYSMEQYGKEVEKLVVTTHNTRLVENTLGLAGEAGEVAEKVKKVLRDKNGCFGLEEKEQIKHELGDVLWYVAQLSNELGIELNEVALANLKKLASRSKRGKISGSGDVR